MKNIYLLIISVCVFAGCGTPVNMEAAKGFLQSGMDAEMSGDYELAEQNYAQALETSPDVGLAIATFNLGRAKGYLCKDEEAEKLLLESLELQEKATGLKSIHVAKHIFTLAIFYYDHNQYKKAEPYYARAIPIVKAFGAEKSDPIGLSNSIEEYATVLKKLGKDNESEETYQKVEALRNQNIGKEPNFIPPRFNKCMS